MEVKKVVVCLLSVFGGLASTYGQEEQFKFVHYSSKEGLPSSYVKDIVQDRHGFIWLANRENVCRFDGYVFKSFPAYNHREEKFNLRTDKLEITADSTLICRGMDERYYYFDPAFEVFRPFDPLNDLGPGVTEVEPARDGLWYLKDEQVHHLDPATGDVKTMSEYFPGEEIGDYRASLIEIKNDRLAVLTSDFRIMVMDSKAFRVYDIPFRSPITLLYFDPYDHLWVGSHSYGLVRIRLSTGEQEFYSGTAGGGKRLLHNIVHTITEDQEGRLWIGTEGGLSIWSPLKDVFSYRQYDLMDPNAPSSNPIYSSLCDRDGNVWLGTYFSGINLWNARSSFFKIIPAGVCSTCLSGNAVSCLVEDRSGNIWIGMEDMGLNMLDVRTGKVRKSLNGVSRDGLSYGNIHALYFETPTNLWIATYTGGINILDTRTGKFEYINTRNNSNLVSDDIYTFLPYGDSIFISTNNGVSLYNRKSGKFSPFYADVLSGRPVESMTRTEGKIWFSSRQGIHYYQVREGVMMTFDRVPGLEGINFVQSDSRDRIWIGDSFTGLYCYDLATGEVKNFNESTQFSGTWIYGLQEGTKGWYWVSTDEGLVKLDPETGSSTLFNSDSGVPFSQFNYRATFKDSKGNIYFGSNQGLIYFNEDSTETFNHQGKQVVFTELKLFNQTLPPGPDEDSPLKKSISMAERIELDYEQNIFTIEFSAQNYGNQGKCHYAYYLEGFETGYNYVGSRNFATYTNLSPGSYTFKVKSSINNSTWDTEVSTLKVIVHPPFWMSGPGYALYAFVLITILVLIYLVGARIQKSKALVQLERSQRAHAVQLNQIKLEFFTNISHELRTPLTLIIGPLSRLLTDQKVSPAVKDRLAGIDLNARRLLGLLNQLLEFRKIESGKLELKVCETKIGHLFDNLDQSFQVTARENGLRLSFDCRKAVDNVWIDLSKLEKILINLISNSFKFTDTGGKIEVTARISEEERTDRQEKILEVTVRDTGRGMESRVVNKVFDRFYQSESSDKSGKVYFGSGIGLAFVQSLVDFHKGSIRVKSRLNVGTIFKVRIPVSRESYSDEEISNTDFIHSVSTGAVLLSNNAGPQPEDPKEGSTKNKPKILLVEDNLELIEFIAGSLSQNYAIIRAHNGAEALEKLADHQADLIMSDVMMPVMDGFEFTTRVKSDFETSHIPVILLTAKSGMDNKFEGLKTGADHYLEKPFMAHILEQTIFNVLNTRRSLIRRFKRDAMMPVTELTHSDSDKEFIGKIILIIKENIDNPSLDVGFITREMAVSRSMLHIKLKKIADCSATEFINTVRLKEAVRLMAEKDLNVSEAAYKTGFSSPAYFTRRFKQYYGQSPRDFLHREAG